MPKNPKDHRIELEDIPRSQKIRSARLKTDDFDAVLDYSSNPIEIFRKVKLPCGDSWVWSENQRSQKESLQFTTPWWRVWLMIIVFHLICLFPFGFAASQVMLFTWAPGVTGEGRGWVDETLQPSAVEESCAQGRKASIPMTGQQHMTYQTWNMSVYQNIWWGLGLMRRSSNCAVSDSVVKKPLFIHGSPTKTNVAPVGSAGGSKECWAGRQMKSGDRGKGA